MQLPCNKKGIVLPWGTSKTSQENPVNQCKILMMLRHLKYFMYLIIKVIKKKINIGVPKKVKYVNITSLTLNFNLFKGVLTYPVTERPKFCNLWHCLASKKILLCCSDAAWRYCCRSFMPSCLSSCISCRNMSKKVEKKNPQKSIPVIMAV